ncbi:MAG: DNA polymerase III subunit [Pirellulales bacterium]|nr:DNA polymerase III subunit [Pirellulales bacterium]
MWQGIQGHDAVVQKFRETLAAGRLATTYLFVGPEGVGKRAFALKLAQSLLCTGSEPAALSPCGRCESCRLFAAGSHPDVDVIGLLPGKRELLIRQFIGEDETRNREGLCHNIAMRPMLGQRRVAVIDDADWLRVESANCLLKTLEEPPPGAVIILIGTSRSRQLPTILSRSQVIRFQPLPLESVRELALANGLAADDAAAARLAERSGGSMTRARDLADDSLFEIRDRFMAGWNAGHLDASRFARELEEFINAAGKEADLRRCRFHQFLALVADRFHAALRQSAIEGHADEAALAAIDRCLEAEEQIDRNANQATLVESWLDDLATILQGQHESTQR